MCRAPRSPTRPRRASVEFLPSGSGAADASRNRSGSALGHARDAPASATDPTAIRGGSVARRLGAGCHDSRVVNHSRPPKHGCRTKRTRGVAWDVRPRRPPAAGRRLLGETRAVAPFCRHDWSQAFPRPSSPPSGTPNDGRERNLVLIDDITRATAVQSDAALCQSVLSLQILKLFVNLYLVDCSIVD